jgi:hypothetical protein
VTPPGPPLTGAVQQPAVALVKFGWLNLQHALQPELAHKLNSLQTPCPRRLPPSGIWGAGKFPENREFFEK